MSSNLIRSVYDLGSMKQINCRKTLRITGFEKMRQAQERKIFVYTVVYCMFFALFFSALLMRLGGR